MALVQVPQDLLGGLTQQPGALQHDRGLASPSLAGSASSWLCSPGGRGGDSSGGHQKGPRLPLDPASPGSFPALCPH